MELTIEQTVAEAMVEAARRAAPLEACGLCGGREGRIVAFYELTNRDASGEHYTMLPEEQFAAVKDMRAKGLLLLAIWHSHPATPARMSEEDKKLAYTPDVAYLITSLADPLAPQTRGFAMEDGDARPLATRITETQQQPGDAT